MAPSIRWNIDDCEMAGDEGWFICHRKRYPQYQIRRLARPNRFVSDKAAVRFVRRRARAGSTPHQIAILVHDFYLIDWVREAYTRSPKRCPKKMRCRIGDDRAR